MKYHIFYDKLCTLHCIILAGKTIKNKRSEYSSSYLTTREKNIPSRYMKNQNGIVQLPNITCHKETTNSLEIQQDIDIIDKEAIIQ